MENGLNRECFQFFFSKLKCFQKIVWLIYLQIQDIKTLDINSQWKLLLLHLGTESLLEMVRYDYIVVMILCSFVSFLRSLLGRPTIGKFYNTVKFLLYSNSHFYELHFSFPLLQQRSKLNCEFLYMSLTIFGKIAFCQNID